MTHHVQFLIYCCCRKSAADKLGNEAATEHGELGAGQSAGGTEETATEV